MEEGAEGSEEGQAGPRRFLTPAAEYLGAAAVALWLGRTFWLPGRFVLALDTAAYTGPNYRVTMDSWRAGRLPVWNEFIYGGVTHLGNPQAGVLSPTKAIGLLFDTHRAMGVTVALHLVLMAVGTVLLLRRLGARPPAGFVAAVVMVANGAVLTRSIQFEQIIVLAWAPLLLWGVTAVLLGDRRPWGAMAATAAVTAMAVLAGHPQIIYQVVLLAAAWAVAMVCCRPDGARIVDLALALGAGAVAATAHLVAVLAATRDSAIGDGRELEELASPALAALPHHLPQIVLGSVQDVDEVVFAGGFESIGHVGVAAAFLGVVGVAALASDRRRRPVAVVLAVMGVLGMIWALGPRTPVFTVAYDWLPGFDLARASGRWIGVTAVCVAIAAGLGVESLRSGTVSQRALRIGVGLGLTLFVATLVLGAFDVVLVPDARTLVPWVVTVLIVSIVVIAGSRWPLAAALGLTFVVGGELAATSRYSPIDTSRSDTAFDAFDPGPAAALASEAGMTVAYTDDAFGDYRYLIAGLRPNTNALAGVRSLDGYDGGVQVTDRYAALLDRLAGDGNTELPLRNQLPQPLAPEVAADLGIRFALVDDRRDAEWMLPDWVTTALSDDTFTVWENPRWPGDAFGLDDTGAVTRFEVEHRSPRHLVIPVDVDDPVRITVFRQSAPGWRVTVDGEPVDLIERDGFFIGLDLDLDLDDDLGDDSGDGPGVRVVEFRYEPRWLNAAFALSGLGTVAISAMAVLGAIRVRTLRSRRADADDQAGPPPIPDTRSRQP